MWLYFDENYCNRTRNKFFFSQEHYVLVPWLIYFTVLPAPSFWLSPSSIGYRSQFVGWRNPKILKDPDYCNIYLEKVYSLVGNQSTLSLIVCLQSCLHLFYVTFRAFYSIQPSYSFMSSFVILFIVFLTLCLSLVLKESMIAENVHYKDWVLENKYFVLNLSKIFLLIT